MIRRRKGPAGQQPPKAWVAEPYQPDQVYYDPTTDPGPLRMALLWFKTKYPFVSCLLSGLFFLGIIAGYIWLIVFAFLQADGKTNWWRFLGAGLIVVPCLALITFLIYRKGRGIFWKTSHPMRRSGQRKSGRQKEFNSDDHSSPPLPDITDPAGFAQRLPKQRVQQRVRGMIKVGISRNKSQKRNEKTSQEPSSQDA